MASLLLISTPSGGLSYDDGDVVVVLDKNTDPGTKVVENSTDSWSFLYINDKSPSDEELVDLIAPGEDLDKRRYCLQLPGDVDQYTTYIEYEDASASMKLDWADVSGFVHDKQG